MSFDAELALHCAQNELDLIEDMEPTLEKELRETILKDLIIKISEGKIGDKEITEILLTKEILV